MTAVGRWQVWAISRYPKGGEWMCGEYRMKWVAYMIARKLPDVSMANATYEVRRAKKATDGR